MCSRGGSHSVHHFKINVKVYFNVKQYWQSIQLVIKEASYHSKELRSNDSVPVVH